MAVTTAPQEIGAIMNEIYDQHVGWRPASGNIKPVHVANGLVRALIEGYYDTDPIVELVVWSAKDGRVKRGDSIGITAELLTNPAYVPFAEDVSQFDQLRRFARGLLRADEAVFPKSDESSLTFTTAQMVSNDYSDRGTGAFAAALLGSSGDRDSLAASVISAVTKAKPVDPTAALCWPIMPSQKHEARPNQLPNHNALNADYAVGFAEQLRHAGADLATHERAQGNGVRTLQRAVAFAVTAIVGHAQSISANGVPDNRSPLLMTVMPSGAEVSRASEASIRLYLKRFEDWLVLQLVGRFNSGSVVHWDGRRLDDQCAALDFLRHIGTSKSGKKDPEAPARRVASLESHLRSGAPVVEALAATLYESYAAEYKDSGPRKFLTGLAARSGLWYPQTGSSRRRLAPSVGMIDMMVRSCIPSGERVTYEAFLDRLWQRFGIVVGGHQRGDSSDFDRLRSHGLEVDQSALGKNSDLFVAKLQSLGLARKYADHVTFVGGN